MVIKTVIDPPRFEVVEREWWTIDPCYSRLYQPPEACPSPCPHATHTSTVEEKTCWKVSGSASAQAKIDLLSGVFRSINLTFTIGAELSGCTTYTNSRAYTFYSRPCWVVFARETNTRRIGSGHIVEGRTCEFWVQERISLPGEPPQYIWVRYCGTTECEQATAMADVVADVEFRLQLPPDLCSYPCGGPCPLPNPADEYQNKRNLPACRPLPPCDVLQPGQLPCCGCIVPP